MAALGLPDFSSGTRAWHIIACRETVTASESDAIMNIPVSNKESRKQVLCLGA